MRRAALVCLLACVALDGCRRRETSPLPSSHDNVTPRAGGRLMRRLDADVKTLNYLLHTGEEERQVLAYLYDPLIAFDVNLEPIPGIVARWDITDGGKTYVLHLDRRATFSDGTPIKASDVVFTLKKIVDANAPQFAGAFANLDRARTVALDEHTVRVGFTETRAAQLLAFNISVVPEHVYGKGTLTDVTAVVGNGPYVLKAREPGRSIIVERRANYWREAPYIDTVLFRVVADDSVAWNALMVGDLDVARVSNDIWWRERNWPAVGEKFTFVVAWLLSYNCIAWNLDDPLFKDAATRARDEFRSRCRHQEPLPRRSASRDRPVHARPMGERQHRSSDHIRSWRSSEAPCGRRMARYRWRRNARPRRPPIHVHAADAREQRSARSVADPSERTREARDSHGDLGSVRAYNPSFGPTPRSTKGRVNR